VIGVKFESNAFVTAFSSRFCVEDKGADGTDAVDMSVGVSVGNAEGMSVDEVGTSVGVSVGNVVGMSVDVVGICVGVSVGNKVGIDVGGTPKSHHPRYTYL